MPKKDMIIFEGKEKFKERVEYMLNLRGYTKQQVANAMRIDKQLFNTYLQNGRIPETTLIRLALTLSCSRAYLMGEVEKHDIEIRNGKKLPLAVEYLVADLDEAEAGRLVAQKPVEMHQVINFVKNANPEELSYLMKFIEAFDKDDDYMASDIAHDFYWRVFKKAFIETAVLGSRIKLKTDDKDELEKKLRTRFYNCIVKYLKKF